MLKAPPHASDEKLAGGSHQSRDTSVEPAIATRPPHIRLFDTFRETPMRRIPHKNIAGLRPDEQRIGPQLEFQPL
jgi:hypothetical protein